MIKAALFESGVAVRLMSGTPRQLNANTSPTRVWRQVLGDVSDLSEVPSFDSLPVHPDHVQRES